jgi:BASS family bile acid:Na+ symporter
MSLPRLALAVLPLIMLFAVALELRMADFQRVLRTPIAVIVGLIPQFVLLPIATLIVTLLVDLPSAVEAAMLLVACCPGGVMSNVITHFGRGNTALSLTLSAAAAPLSMVMTPFNFGWMVAVNPATRNWLREISVSPFDLAGSLLFMLLLPMLLGLWLAHVRPAFAARIAPSLTRGSIIVLMSLILIVIVDERALLTSALALPFVIVVLHNALGLTLGASFARLCRLDSRSIRAVTLEAGMQNSAIALSIIALHFQLELAMLLVASLWGVWHLISGFALAVYWRSRDA